MPKASAAALSSAPARRDRSVHVRRKARKAKADHEQQIVGLLNCGLSVAEIASRSGVSIKHMRNLVRKILAERMPQPPAEYLALQVSRLNEALLVSYGAAQIERRWTRPREVGARALGHHGFFSEHHRTTLWRDALDWIDARA